MKLSKSAIIDLILLTCIGIFFCFYNLSKLYSFEFDQERDYNIVKSIAVDHKLTLIGPRVVSSAGFYLGPWYFYSQVPFFLAFKGDPLYGAYFTGAINLSICLLFYFVIKKLTGSRLISLAAAILWVSSSNRINWNVSFVPLFLLCFLHLYSQFLKAKSFKIFWLLTLTMFLSLNFHPQMIFILPLWCFAAIKLIRSKKINEAKIIFLVITIILPFLPLALFDLRHEFVNTNALLNFISHSSAKNADVSSFRPLYSLRQFSTSLTLIHPAFKHNLLLTTLILLIGIIISLFNLEYLYLLVPTILSIFILSFYKELTWPEYYNLLSSLTLFILFVVFISKHRISKILFTLFSLYVVWLNFQTITKNFDPGSYYFKKAMIQWMLEKNKPYEKLNIENDFKYGDGLGFTPIRDYYEKKTGQYNPDLKFYVSYTENPKHNPTKQAFGLYAVSLIQSKK